MNTNQRFLFALVLAISLVACSKPAVDHVSSGSAGQQGPRKISSVKGMVAGFLPARVVICIPDLKGPDAIPYLGPEGGSDGTNPVMMPLWMPDGADKLKLEPGDWIQFDLTIDWSQFKPLQISPNLTKMNRRDKPEACLSPKHS